MKFNILFNASSNWILFLNRKKTNQNQIMLVDFDKHMTQRSFNRLILINPNTNSVDNTIDQIGKYLNFAPAKL